MCVFVCTRVFRDIEYQCFRWLKVLAGARSWVRVSGPICPILVCVVHVVLHIHMFVCESVQLCARVHCGYRRVCVGEAGVSMSAPTKGLPLETPTPAPGMKPQR